jgi:hypothetical protein
MTTEPHNSTDILVPEIVNTNPSEDPIDAMPDSDYQSRISQMNGSQKATDLSSAVQSGASFLRGVFQRVGLVDYNISVKSQESPQDARHRRYKELLLLSVGLLGICVTGAFCLWILTSASASPDDKKWAQSTVAALIGYLTGKGTK